MKKSAEVIDLPIVSIENGDEIGHVKNLVINPDTGSADFLTIEHVDWQVSVKAIPFKKIVGIGEYAVTVESKSSILDLNEIPIANELISKNIQVTGTKLITRKGELLGEILEYYIDETNGKILGVLMHYQGEDIVLDQESILTYGEKISIGTDDAINEHSSYKEQFGEPKEEESYIQPTPHQAEALVSNKNEHGQEQSQSQTPQLETLADVEQQQLELLKGKTVLKDIVNPQGDVIIENGKTLTAEDVEMAQNEGPSVVVDITMNVNE